MGDHRASIKIEFSMHGHEDKCDMWLNYFPNEDCTSCLVDRRVLVWLSEAYETAMHKYFEAKYDADMIAAAKQENKEREELARLQAKYGKTE